MTLNLNFVKGDDVSQLYKGIKCENLPNVNVKSIYYNKNKYELIKYVKNNINKENVLTDGLFRSVISRDGRVLSFSPPKSLYKNDFVEKYNMEECYAEEFIEGTMINLFYDKKYKNVNDENEENEEGKWVISTKSNIGARNAFFTLGHINKEDTFQHMFYDACKHVNLNYDVLDKEYQYSFVLQHPRNRIVLNIKEPKLYLISVNKISDDNVLTKVENYIINNINIPKKYYFKEYKEIEKRWEKSENSVECKEMGLVVFHKDSGNRTKFRNPQYEYVKLLRGNQPKLEYRFIELWQNKQIKDYLLYFPESKTLFDKYWLKLSKFIDNTFNNYVECYVLKNKRLKDFPFEYRTHMYEIHSIYKNVLKKEYKVVTIPVIINYFKNLHPAKMMFSINYVMRPNVTK